jgi:hypothetical protein
MITVSGRSDRHPPAPAASNSSPAAASLADDRGDFGAHPAVGSWRRGCAAQDVAHLLFQAAPVFPGAVPQPFLHGILDIANQNLRHVSRLRMIS